MIWKAVLIALGCLLAWLVLLPLLVIGGGVTLLAYAILAELGALILGDSAKALDTADAREIARRMCGGCGTQNTRRYPARADFRSLNGATGPTSTSS
jgi:hypothetical protein